MTETQFSETEFADLHDDLRTAARTLLTAREAGEPIPLWVLAAQGWLDLELPTSLGGAGATFAETAILLEESGRALATTGYLGATLALDTAKRVVPTSGRDEMLRIAATSEVALAAALSASADICDPTDPPFRLHGEKLSGRAEFVPDAAEADHLLLLAADSSGAPVVVPVAAGTPGLERTTQPVLDDTRSFADIVADGIDVQPDSVWRFADDPAATVALLRARASLAIACDSLGVSEAALAATVAYVSTREQFGRPVGSFQAVQHACADMLVRVTVARRLITAAVETLVTGTAASATTSTAMAKSYTCAAAVDIAGKAMQLHGGFGYTWEGGIHRHLKRATLNRSLFGSPTAHRRLLAARYRTDLSQGSGTTRV